MSDTESTLPDWLHELCGRVCAGEGVNEVCRDDHMPHESTVYRHMAKNDEVASRIARAREAQQDFEADNCVKMADAATAEDWQVVKLRIWARQWRAAKLAPKKYGEKVGLDHSGDIGLTVNIVRYGDDQPSE